MVRLNSLIIKLSLLLLLAGSLFAQQRQTVYETLLTNAQSAPGHPLPISNNIGQLFHTFTIAQTVAPPTGSCTVLSFPYNFFARVQLSYDNVNWFQATQTRISFAPTMDQSTNYGGLAAKYYRVAGAYPYVRLQIDHTPQSTGTCEFSVYYTGTLGASTLQDTSNNYYISKTIITATNTCTGLFNSVSAIGSSGALDPFTSTLALNLVALNILSNSTTQPIFTYYKNDASCTVPSEVIQAQLSTGQLTIGPDSLFNPIGISPITTAAHYVEVSSPTTIISTFSFAY